MTKAVRVTERAEGRLTWAGMVSNGRTSTDIRDRVETDRWVGFGRLWTMG